MYYVYIFTFYFNIHFIQNTSLNPLMVLQVDLISFNLQVLYEEHSYYILFHIRILERTHMCLLVLHSLRYSQTY